MDEKEGNPFPVGTLKGVHQPFDALFAMAVDQPPGGLDVGDDVAAGGRDRTRGGSRGSLPPARLGFAI
jgi:hypothetical protein